VTEDSSLIANFLKLYDVTLSASPSEGGYVNGGGTYEKGEQTVLRALPAEGYTFEGWTSDGDTLSTDSTCVISVYNDTILTANFQQIVTSVGSGNKMDFRIFPNPASDRIQIQGLSNTFYELSIFDVNGRKVKHKQINGSSPVVNVSELKAGMYIVRIRDVFTQFTSKLIVR